MQVGSMTLKILGLNTKAWREMSHLNLCHRLTWAIKLFHWYKNCGIISDSTITANPAFTEPLLSFINEMSNFVKRKMNILNDLLNQILAPNWHHSFLLFFWWKTAIREPQWKDCFLFRIIITRWINSWKNQSLRTTRTGLNWSTGPGLTDHCHMFEFVLFR